MDYFNSLKMGRLIFTVLFSTSLGAVAASSNESLIHIEATTSDPFNSKEYYVFKVNHQVISSPQYNLMDVDLVPQKFPKPTVAYNRAKHFGGWIAWKDDLSCLNTRGLVLERESLSKVQMGSCSVQSGEWLDPYTNMKFYNSSELQIDHLVPLRNAYMTGADKWTPQKRCLYANYLGNDIQLIPVMGRENLKKGDKLPGEYLPPYRAFKCEYIKNWLKVKMIWNLKLTSYEYEGIKEKIRQNQCDAADFVVSRNELLSQRKTIEKNMDVCGK